MNWTGWWQRLKEWAGRLMVARSPPCPKPEPPAWEPESVLGAETETAPAPSQETAASPSEEVKQLSIGELAHIYELERQKHDKWVKPKGALKRKRKRKADEEETDPEAEHVDPVEDDRQHPPARPIPVLDGGLVPDEHLIIDEHHEGGKVLYREPEFWGEFNFRDTILEQLERYFVYIRRMRNSDPQSYGLYRAVGAYLVPYSATDAAGWLRVEGGDMPWHKFTEEQLERLRNKHMPPHFNKVRPAFGCVAFGTNKTTEQREMQKDPANKLWLWIPKFMYYTKFKTPPVEWEQAPRDGDVYRLTIWWDRPQDPEWKRKHGTPQVFGVWVSRDGRQIKVLKKKGKWNRWAIPGEYKEWAHSHGVPVQLYLCGIFLDAITICEEGDLNMIRVNCHRGSLTAVFGVNPGRLSYFFKDRDVTIGAGGQRQRIFHAVKPHRRKDGKLVKMHFRGLREFDWAGHHVQITVPGLHHVSLAEFRHGAIELKKGEKGSVDDVELGRRLAEYIKTGEVKNLSKGKEDGKEG